MDSAAALAASVGFGALAGWAYAGFPGGEMKRPVNRQTGVHKHNKRKAKRTCTFRRNAPLRIRMAERGPKMVPYGARARLTAHLLPCVGRRFVEEATLRLPGQERS